MLTKILDYCPKCMYCLLLYTIYGTYQSPHENMILNKCNYIPCPLQYNYHM